jgi:GTPase SAR1 family protein
MVGDGQIGKTSLMVKYVEGSFEFVTLFPMARRG